MVKDYFKGIIKDKYILYSLVNRDLQAKYRKSMLGVLWSILTPLGLVVIIGTVYSIIFGTDPKVFIPALFAGLNPWIFINTAADGGTLSFLSAEGYIKQTNVNSQIFPLRVTLVAFVNLIYSIDAFLIIYLFLQPNLFSPKMLMIIPGLLILLIFSIGMANISAVVNLKIRDFQPLQSIILQGLFYATPIIFPAEILKQKGFEIIYKINPFYYILEVVKKPMLGEQLPSIQVYIIAILLSVILFFTGIFLIMRIRKKLAFYL